MPNTLIHNTMSEDTLKRHQAFWNHEPMDRPPEAFESRPLLGIEVKPGLVLQFTQGVCDHLFGVHGVTHLRHVGSTAPSAEVFPEQRASETSRFPPES